MFFVRVFSSHSIKRRLIQLLLATAVLMSPFNGLAGLDNTEEVMGEASYYSQRFVGKRTTSGEQYDDKAFTAAHAYHPFGTYLLVTCIKNQQSVVVRVNDRFRPRKGHLVDISMAAAKQIDLVRSGRARITLRIVEDDEALSLMIALGQVEAPVRLDSVTFRLAMPEIEGL